MITLFFHQGSKDSKLKYGDTVRFLNNEYVNKEKLSSFLQLEDHRKILDNMVERYNEFNLSEELIKDIHRDLMRSDLSWNGDYYPHQVFYYFDYKCRLKNGKTPESDAANYHFFNSMNNKSTFQ